MTSTPRLQAIISFHGATKDATEQLGLDGLTNTTINTDNIIVYPNSIGEHWEGSPRADADDVGFTNSIIDYLEQNYCIDTSRIYATGKSQGGGFVGVLACDSNLSKRIAAFAPVSGAFYVDNFTTCPPDTVKIICTPGRPKIPFLEFHGGNDDTIAYEGDDDHNGSCLPSIPHYIHDWAKRNGLTTKNVTSTVTSDTVLYTYGTGADTGLVQHVFDSSIGHDWPSTTKNDDNDRKHHQPATFNATPMILDFFSKWSL
ncbi:hypothetical protein NQ176_g2310 [Zarea fungicola]|uniref:Uncharacterized protein n=1 Tax=Zarea fungicola TaxID=93591 RepID=A0ACC1NR82_9HYPO|nr:hypothetical protein NQ176_g2310 [Lecanicillium fungicola]